MTQSPAPEQVLPDLGDVIRAVYPEAMDEPVALYVAGVAVQDAGVLVNGELLVTVWASGEVECAMRAEPNDRWGPPINMESRPTHLH